MYIALGTLCVILSRKKNNEAIKLRTCFNKTQQSHKLVHLKLGPVSIVKMGEKNSASNAVFHSKNRGFWCETLGLRIYQYQMLMNGIIARFRISLFGPQGQKSQSLGFFLLYCNSSAFLSFNFSHANNVSCNRDNGTQD